MSNALSSRYERYEVYLTFEQFERLHAVDKEWVGSEHYMGLAYFWAYEYRHYLRDASAYQRVRVHSMMLDEGLELDGESDDHLRIVAWVTRSTKNGIVR